MSSRAKTAGDATAFDANAFRESLEQAFAAELAGRRHGAVSAVMRRAASDARLSAFQYGDRGDKIALQLSRAVDAMTGGLFQSMPRDGVAFALCAVGGYGRKELAPFSDVDLLFLHEPASDAVVRRALDFILYPMWDSGMKIGHGVHTPKSAATFAKEDMVARTSFLDARLVAGSRSLFEAFKTDFDKLRRRTGADFVAAKLREQDERQRAAGATRYLVEPNIKEGKGGLRDVQTIRWIYKYVYGGSIGESVEIDKILGEKNVRELVKAERFLWSVRAHLHDLRGRADEHLTFDIQPLVAERLGYADRREMAAAERLMRHYFVTAVDTGRLTRVLCARLEEESAKRLPRLPRLLPKALQRDEATGAPNVRIRNGRLDFASAARAAKRPRDFFRLFRAFSKSVKLDFHPDALALVAENVAAVTSEVRKDAETALLFKGILESNEHPERTLRLMTETGLLGKYVPAFGSIVGRIHYSLYRRFTLDEQVLRTIGVLRDIRMGRLKNEHPISTRIVKAAENPYIITLGLFLHESVWTVKGKSAAECEKLIVRIAKRLGLSSDEARLTAWGAANFLLLVRTAERRNLTEAHAIAHFAAKVGGQDRLDLMLVLSTCHLRIVGPAAWDEVIRRQLTELYDGASAWFSGGMVALENRLADRASAARADAHERLADSLDAEPSRFLNQLTDDMLRSLDTDIIVRFAHLAQAAEQDAEAAAVTVTPRDGDFECIVRAEDRAGLLADIAGAIAGAGLSVRSVQALTTADGRAFDVFSVQSADGLTAEDPELAQSLRQKILDAASGPLKKQPNLKRRLGDRRTIFSVEPEVRIEREASIDAAVVEAEGLDRPGLLYEMASALGRIGVSIASAHVATYGERAVDAFYLTDADGRKISDSKTLGRIERALLDVLASGSGA